jgi:hypothetical protein
LCAAQELALCVDFKQDESYTPKTLAVRAGNSIQDMKARRRDLHSFCVVG